MQGSKRPNLFVPSTKGSAASRQSFRTASRCVSMVAADSDDSNSDSDDDDVDDDDDFEFGKY